MGSSPAGGAKIRENCGRGPALLTDAAVSELSRLEPSEAYLDSMVAGGAEVVSAGPFRAVFSRQAASMGLNYAVPVGELTSECDTAASLQVLRHLFKSRGRKALIEFNDPLWPSLPQVLASAGFTERTREPLMICSRADFRPFANEEVSVRFLGHDDDEQAFAAYRAIFKHVMGADIWTSTGDVRREAAQGGHRTHALAIVNGTPVATGYVSSFDGTAEITRVATLPELRRRGVAATLTSFMVGYRFGTGDTLVWLTAQDASAQALYEKLGFRLVGARVVAQSDD